MNIGIIGNGFVGKATYQLKCKDINILSYDINPELCNPIGTKMIDLLQSEFIFVSVPTPMQYDGSCYLTIVKSVIKQLEDLEYNGFIVLRSTVPTGISDYLKCYFMPEFLTEKNYIYDFIENKDWIFGLFDDGRNEKFKENMSKLFQLAYDNERIKHNNLNFVSNKEAEMIKMFKNCFLSVKVSFCNEMYEYCKLRDIEYENVRRLACNDDRILHSHTKVPGPDGRFGFGGTCFPKDTSSMRHEMEKVGMKPYVLDAIIERNNKKDRVEKDWIQDIGRAFVKE
jgi:UDPglucose 6-dehydrogenase